MEAGRCSFCEKVIEGQSANLTFPDGEAELCSWHCVAAFALKQLHDLDERRRKEFNDLRQRLKLAEDDAYLADFYRAGVL
jgi:hypothetical protein